MDQTFKGTKAEAKGYLEVGEANLAKAKRQLDKGEELMKKFRKTEQLFAEPVEDEPVPDWVTLALLDDFVEMTTERQLQTIPKGAFFLCSNGEGSRTPGQWAVRKLLSHKKGFLNCVRLTMGARRIEEPPRSLIPPRDQ